MAGKTYESTKEYLSQISRMDRMIQNKISEISQLKTLSASITSLRLGEKVQTSPNYDKIGTAYTKIEEMEEKLDDIIDEYVDLKNEIISQIDSLENENCYQVLFAKYVEKKTFEKISTEMNYSFRQITRLHGKALREFEKKYGNLYLEKKNVS